MSQIAKCTDEQLQQIASSNPDMVLLFLRAESIFDATIIEKIFTLAQEAASIELAARNEL